MSDVAVSSADDGKDAGLARARAVLDAVHVPASETALIDDLLSRETPAILSFVNAHGMNMAAGSDEFTAALTGSDALVRDGSGMKILMKLLGRDPGPNLNGTDLIPKLIARVSETGAPIALLGTGDEWLEKASTILRAQGAFIALTRDGFQGSDVYVRALNERPCRLVILAMGMPKQELIAQLLKTSASGPCLIVNGGAVVDFIASKVTRAPGWMRAMGLEWLYRLAQEPRRMAKRYIYGNAVFLIRALRLKTSAQK